MDAGELAVLDSIISLDIKLVGARELRVMQVLRLRGSSYRSGEHAYRNTGPGFDVFPRLADVQDGSLHRLGAERSSTGIEALAKVLGEGGYWTGAATMVAGPSGIGKTLMGLHFLFRGAESGEPGILATYQENETPLIRVARNFGWTFADSAAHVPPTTVVAVYTAETPYHLL